jgi:hypothetical protein
MRTPAAAFLILALLLPDKPIVLKDPACGYPPMAAADCILVRATPTDAGLEMEVTLGAPLEKGMFTCVHVFVDADANPETGIQGLTGPGKELWFRAAVGSRFRPNDAAAIAGVPSPLTLARTSRSEVTTQQDLTNRRTGRNWLHWQSRAKPEVDGAKVLFTVPGSLITEANNGYASPYTFEVDVETSCADQPLFLEYRGVDEGLPVVVDGDDRDWSGGPSVLDPGGELFAALRCLDLLRLRVDHDGLRLLVCLDTEVSGFAERHPPCGDVSVDQSVTVLAEPLDADYESPRRIRIPRGRPRATGTDYEFAVKDRTIEVALPRTGLDGRVRVLAWSESVHHDRVPDSGSVRVGSAGK